MATNKVYSVVQDLITFQDSGGSAVIALINLAATTGGRLSARFDRGAGAKPAWAWLWGEFQMETAGVIGETIIVYVVNWSSHGTPLAEGALGTTDAAFTADQARNVNGGVPSLIVTVDKTGTATSIIAKARVFVPGRYVSVAVRNLTADNLENTANANKVSLEWIVDDIQAAA